jgi:hypothetical protein
VSFYFRQLTYKTPGIYLWMKPSTIAGSGPFGSTYLETIFVCIGAGSGGSSGTSTSGTAAGTGGGPGGNGGAYAQATYLPGALPAFENLIVGAGSPGAIANPTSSNSVNSNARVDSVNAGLSSITSSSGVLLNCPGGQTSASSVVSTPTVNGGSNVVQFSGCANLGVPTINNVASPGASISTGFMVVSAGNHPSWQVPPGNNCGAAGGCVNTVAFALAHGVRKACNGGGIAFLGGGQGLDDSITTAGAGVTPGAGGGAAGSVLAIAPITAGNGAPALNNTGAGGGGGGGAELTSINSPGLFVTGGNGGKGSDGLIQTTDIYTFPALLPPTYFDWDKAAYFHMMNMARPISLTGRYQS